MRKLAIVIPVLGCVKRLETTLVSVLENRPHDCELLVVLNGRYDDPYKLADEVRFVEARRGAGLVDSVNAGIEQATAPIVHVLSAGVEVCEGWTDTALRQFKDPHVAAVAPLVLNAQERDQIVTAGVSYRASGRRRHVGRGRAVAGLGPWVAEVQGPSLLAGFYRKAALDALGGFDRFVGDAHADVDWAIRSKASGHRSVVDPQSKVFAPTEILVRRGSALRHSLGAERMFLRHVPEGRWVSALAAHTMVVAGEFCCSLPRPAALLNLIGRAAAWTHVGKCRNSQPLAEVSTAAEAPVPVPRPHAGSLRGAGLQSASKG